MKIRSKELEILKILWESERPMNAKEISLTSEGMVMSTVQSTLRSLLKKGLIQVEDIVHSGTVLSRRYVPTIEQEEYINKQFNNLSISNLLGFLLGENNQRESEEEIDEIIKLLNNRKNKG